MPDITYVGKSEGEYFELFHYLADGGRPVLELLVDPEDKIWISGCAGFGVPVPQVTKGTAHRHVDEAFESIGIDTAHVCIGSIAAYVVPRIGTLMGRVYCPNVKENDND